MPRRLKVATVEMGFVELYLIYDVSGTWEAEWQPLQGAPLTSLLTVISKETLDHVLHGWSSPFVKALGISPDGALRKIPPPSDQCAQRAKCPYYEKAVCIPRSKKMPWCFEPDGHADDEKRRLASEVIRYWREGVYVVVVQEDPDAQRERRPRRVP